MTDLDRLFAALDERYGDAGETIDRAALPDGDSLPSFWSRLAARGSVRRFTPEPPPLAQLQLLAALALAAPTKSDLQQRDIVIITEERQLRALKDLLTDQDWVKGAPALVVFCGNHRRQRGLHELRDHVFVNDHLDAFFNASVDAAIALTTFVLAAESAGLGTCPISAIRNRAEEASEILALPDLVFPIAALAVGHPLESSRASFRLPLAATLHHDRYGERDREETIVDYDRRRAAAQPYGAQRLSSELGTNDDYGWSEDKARQYSRPERADFGAFIRRKGFRLD
ncbi:nitroreductase family protein [Pelagibius sp. Alg239-R121]|uniref:nitroreductase family protein n=1 Tax=Pelagibius sp. Alg239-R121 TaxID=2993448 RepID=UPI0024A78EB7|nr:nitroreductase family protein [Pelagibius sp. Alg239-R121]